MATVATVLFSMVWSWRLVATVVATMFVRRRFLGSILFVRLPRRSRDSHSKGLPRPLWRQGVRAALEPRVKLEAHQWLRKRTSTDIAHTLLNNLTMETPPPSPSPQNNVGKEKRTSFTSKNIFGPSALLSSQHCLGGRGAPVPKISIVSCCAA